MNDTTIKTAPERIWLQLGDDPEASRCNKLAEICNQYLKKGSQVYVEGKLQTRKWQAQDGQDRYTTEIIASDMQMLGGKSDDGRASNAGRKQTQDGYPQQWGRPAGKSRIKRLPMTSTTTRHSDVSRHRRMM